MKGKASLIFIGAALLALAACSDDTETRLAAVPTVTLSPSSVTLSAEAVSNYTINYSVSNPGEGASVSCTADVSWLSGIDYSVSGQVRFSVAANSSDEMRTGTLTLTYSYDGGAVTAKTAVVQYGAGDPVLSVDPNAVVASAEGGKYSFGYAVDNPIDGESVSCSADAGWVSGFDYSVWGEVSFTVAESEEEGLRTATITVSYASLSKEVTVVQDHPGSGDDSGSGGGGIVGTYTVSGYTYDGDMTWTMTIHQDTSDPDKYWIDGLTPSDEGNYPYGTSYCAYGHYGSETTFVIPSQVSDWYDSSNGVYLGWTPCTEYDGGSWYYSSQFPDLTFTSKGNDTWVSDYGVFLGAFLSKTLSKDSFDGFFDVVAPSLTITKVSDDPDGGDGGDYPNYSDMTGTYSCSGYGRISGGYDNATWDMYITAKSDTEYYVYCLTPYAGGIDIADAGSSYWAVGHWSTETTFVVPSQVCRGQVNSSSGDTYYWGYTPCVEYDGSSWKYSSQYPDLTFTKTGDDTWESDYGVFAAGFSTTALSSMQSYFGVTAPTVKATKTSSTVPESIRAAAASGRSLSAEAYTNFRVSSAPAMGAGLVTRSLGSIRQADAKLAK